MKLSKPQEDLVIYLIKSKEEIIIKQKFINRETKYILSGNHLNHYKSKVVDNLIEKNILVNCGLKIILNFNNLFLRNFYQKLLINNEQFYSKIFSRKELYDYLYENNLINFKGDTDFHYINIDDLSRDFQGKYYVCLFYRSYLCGISMLEDYRDYGYYIKYNNKFITCLSTISIRDDMKGKGISKYLLAHTFKNIPNSKILYITDFSREATTKNVDKTINKLYTNKLLNKSMNLNHIQKIKIK